MKERRGEEREGWGGGGVVRREEDRVGVRGKRGKGGGLEGKGESVWM